MVDYITPVVTHWVSFVFGEPVVAGIIFLFFFTIIAMRRGWGGDMFIAMFIPLIFLLVLPGMNVLPTSLAGIVIIGSGFIIGLGLLLLIRKR